MTRRKGVKHIFLKKRKLFSNAAAKPAGVAAVYLGSSLEAAFTRPHPLVNNKKGRLAPALPNVYLLATTDARW